MNQLFPPEIIEHTSEAHFAKHSKRRSIIYLSVLFCILVGIGITPFIQIKVTRQSRGIIRSEFENNTVQTAVYGLIEKINISDNQEVNVGDTLLVLDFQKLNEQCLRIKQHVSENQQFINDIDVIINYNSYLIESSKYESEYKSYLAQLNEQQVQTNYLLSEKQIADQLYAKDVIPKQEHAKTINTYNASVNREKVLHDQFHSRLLSEKVLLENQNRELLSQNQQIIKEKEMYVVCAPTNGTIIKHSGLQVGNFAMPNQVVAEISPEGNLLVECYVSPSDIGFFKNGMNVNFQLDAFNYNQWGMATGKVIDISNDIVSMEKTAVFKVRCQLDSKYLQLKTGYKGELIKGMTLTARFSLTERTLSQLAFDKVDNWLNPKIVSGD